VALWLLCILPLLALVYFGYNRWHKQARKKIGNPELVKTLLKGYKASRRHVRFILLFLIITLSIVTLAGPRQQGKGEPDLRRGIDLVIAMDVSKSMLAADPAPDRLEHAKKLVNEVLEKRTGDRVGLVLFAGHAYTQLPLTYDHSSAKLFIKNADPLDFTAQGTAIGDALQKSHTLLTTGLKRYRVVLLLTDGETFDDAVEDNNAAFWTKNCSEAGIMIITAGFGSVAGSTIIDPLTRSIKKDKTGKTVTSSLNVKLLQEMAARTNGVFVQYDDTQEAAKKILDKLAAVKQTALADQSLLSFTPLYIWVAIPLLLLLIIDFFIPERKKKLL
jgi:Ca-activated chloride channel homolog